MESDWKEQSGGRNYLAKLSNASEGSEPCIIINSIGV